MVTVRRAADGDAGIVRGLRLQALTDAPDAFDSTLEREVARTPEAWRRLLASGATFILEGKDGPAGLAAGVPDHGDRDGVFLVSVWVHPARRGTGAADALVAAVLAWAEAHGARRITLHVGKHNERARRCYERHGFRATGQEMLRARDGVVEVEMRRVLSPRRSP